MSMKKVITCLVAACALAFSLVLCGCGPSYDEDEVRTQFLGTWTLSSIQEGGADVSADDIESMKKMNIVITATFNDDGTFNLDMMGDKVDGTFEVTDDNQIATSITTYEDMTGTIENGTLILDDGASQLLFTKE